ncbi:MAG: hypothetical protein IJ575_08935 [Selenomonadaceae bacterium]|nr:hypothetical protein [Selenomonadaceae bacterium]
MIRKFCLMIAMIFSMLPTIVHATDSDVLLADMYAHPENYIYYHSMGLGTGLRASDYINRNSIDVQEYDPPNYIIAFNRIMQDVNANLGTIRESARDRITRYSYDLDSKKMYIEKCEDGVCHWEYLDPAQMNYSRFIEGDIAGGELAFYLAYHQSFYDEFKSLIVKRFVEEGTSPVRLINFEVDSTSCIYNHVTHELEFWRYEGRNRIRVK